MHAGEEILNRSSTSTLFAAACVVQVQHAGCRAVWRLATAAETTGSRDLICSSSLMPHRTDCALQEPEGQHVPAPTRKHQ